MKKLLIVDFDKPALKIFSDTFHSSADNFEIYSTDDGIEISNILTKHEIDLLIIDLEDFSDSDFEFLDSIILNHPEIPISLIVSFETPEIENKIKSYDSIEYFKKPIEIKSFSKKILEKFDTSVGGQLQGISLASFLQMVDIEKTTCTLKISTTNNEGYLYLLKGDLISAETKKNKNIKAAYEIISWDNTIIEMENICNKDEKEIDKPLINILTDGLKIKDKIIAKKKERRNKEKIKKKVNTRLKDQKKLKSGIEEKAPVKKKPPVPEKQEEPEPVATITPLKKSKKLITPVGKTLSKESTTTPKKTGKKNKRLFIVIASAASIFILILVVIWIKIINPKVAENKYQDVLSEVIKLPVFEEKINILQNYINTNENSHSINKANYEIEKYRKLIINREFQSTITKVKAFPIDNNFEKNALDAYSEFLQKYPENPKTEVIKEKISGIQSVIDDNDYEKLKNVADLDIEEKVIAYKQYLVKHPEGNHSDSVSKSLSDFEVEYYNDLMDQVTICEKEKKWEKCIAECKKFVSLYSTGERSEKAQLILSEMVGGKELIALTSKAEEDKNDYGKSKAIYLDYLKKHPDTIIKDSIEKKIAAIQKKINQKKEWEKTKTFCKNKQNDIFERVNILEKYLAENDSVEYSSSGKKILKQLYREKNIEVKRIRKENEIQRREKIRLAKIQKEKDRLSDKTMSISAVLKKNGRFKVRNNGTVIDTKTGLTWCVLDSQISLKKCVNYKEANNYVKNLRTGGFKDWRLPSSNELLAIYKNKPFYPAAGAKWYWTSEVFSAAWDKKVNVITSKNESVMKKMQVDISKCGAVHAVRQ
ncbi:MAG: DUF1566 domain-containing protein [Desulfobacteraceae bacterium]|jgi:hypothetical protein|nr:DUF1566 domain-containing protein [Desulfobacteraceae bacterium]MBT4363141.1 DUF1566 domain-containing protein [Desulfobacteraceae bacterium]